MSLDAFKTNGSSPPKRFHGYFPGQVADNPPSDFLVSNHGTIFLLEPMTDAAVAWVDAYLPADLQLFGASIAVEHRYIRDIVEGAVAAGGAGKGREGAEGVEDQAAAIT